MTKTYIDVPITFTEEQVEELQKLSKAFPDNLRISVKELRRQAEANDLTDALDTILMAVFSVKALKKVVKDSK